MVRRQDTTAAAGQVPVDEIQGQQFRSLRSGVLGQRQRSQTGAGVRNAAVVRQDRQAGGRARPRLSAGSAKRGPDRDAAAELQVRQVRAGQRQGPADGRHDHRRPGPFRARPDHRQQRVSVAAQLQVVQEVGVHVREQRRVSRGARRPTAGRRRPHIRRRVRLPERFPRRLRGDLLRGRRGRTGQEAVKGGRKVHVQRHRGLWTGQELRGHRPGHRTVRPSTRPHRGAQHHRPRHRHVLPRATHHLPLYVARLPGRDETGHGVHRRTGDLPRRRRRRDLGRRLDHSDGRRF